MKRLTIQSTVAQDILSNMGRPKTMKALRKALRRASPKFAGQARQQKRGAAKIPLIHRQFTPAMQKAVTPILVKAVADGELDPLVCGMIETQINKSICNPFFRLDRKYMSFLNRKLRANGWEV